MFPGLIAINYNYSWLSRKLWFMDRHILIIGGGVIGLSIARELHKIGVRQITLIEKGVCGGEASWAAAGMLGPQADSPGTGAFFDLCCASRDLFPALASELLDETGIDIDLDRAGTLYLAFTDADMLEIAERYNAHRNAGLAIEYLSADKTRRTEPFVSPDVRESLFFADDWQVDNRKLCAALTSYALSNGITIRENTTVESLLVEDGRVTGVEAGGERFDADSTVIATGAWTSLIKLGEVALPVIVEPVRGQMIAFHTAKRLFQRVIQSSRGYLVPRTDGRILVGSTTEKAGFEKTVTNAAEKNLTEMAYEVAPSISGLQIADSWSGLRPFAADALPLLGPIDGVDGLVLATAHYRNGILLAPITARLIAAKLISGAGSEYFDTFGTGRFRLRSVVTNR